MGVIPRLVRHPVGLISEAPSGSVAATPGPVWIIRWVSYLLQPQTLGILVLGVIAFCVGTAAGVLMAKLMNVFSRHKINPLIGSAGVSAVPMAARVSNKVGLEAWGDPTLPSALRRFTSEFGMGSGGTTALVPPGKFFVLSTQFFILRTQL